MMLREKKIGPKIRANQKIFAKEASRRSHPSSKNKVKSSKL